MSTSNRDGNQERVSFLNIIMLTIGVILCVVAYLIYTIGLIIMFIVICLLVIDLLKLKNIETVIAVRSEDNQGPLDKF